MWHNIKFPLLMQSSKFLTLRTKLTRCQEVQIPQKYALLLGPHLNLDKHTYPRWAIPPKTCSDLRKSLRIQDNPIPSEPCED
jgi:hypothetical protein